ncbi:MAG: porin, partial [Pelistega sp.]|nr:porin [Pelistega sp.]
SGIDPFGTAWGNAAATSTFGDSLSARQSPTLKYVSPSFDGFKFAVSTGYTNTKESEGSSTTGKVRNTVASAAIGYANGPVELGVSYDYDRKREQGTIGTKAVSANRLAKAWTIAGAYDFDVAKLHLGYGQQRDGFVGGNLGLLGTSIDVAFDETQAKDIKDRLDTAGLRAQAWFAGVSAPIGESAKVIFSYQVGRVKHKAAYFEGYRANTHVWSLGYQQNLSKRTHVYVLGSYGQTKVKESGVGTAGKARHTQAVVGLQHRF